MTLPRLLVSLCLLCVLGIAPRVAAADERGLAQAKLHFERGEKLYAQTRFREALEEYQKAFDARPLADFLFNIGQCYRNLGDYDSAVFSYRQYLKLAPAAPNRRQVEQLILELEAKRDQREAERDTQRFGLQPQRPSAPAEPAAPPAEPGPAVHSSILGRWWFWTAVVAITAGGVTIYEVTRPDGPPRTDLGNIVFGK